MDLSIRRKENMLLTEFDADSTRVQYAVHHVSVIADDHAAADSAGRSRR
jgi:hypothetical protein